MALIEWNNDLSVSVSAFDSEHSRLIDLINELHSAMMSGKGRTVLQKTLQDLLEYTRYHFTHEEEALKKYNYPELDLQVKQHRLFVDKLKNLTEKQEKGELFVPVEVLEFLNSWLVNHIKGEDKKYGSLLGGKPV
jgi:hemerythrin-like metal-binding protein